MPDNEKEFFIGIDLGVKEKRTTGICILEKVDESVFPSETWCKICRDIVGKDVFKVIGRYLKETKVIAIDAPLTRGRGKGKMRLYEKFLSTKIFRKEKVNPIPPILMPNFCDFALEINPKLEKKGFALDLNLIEVFPTLIKKICNEKFFLFNCPASGENQKSASICAITAFLHANFKTRYLGYRDGFLFLPEMTFWGKSWRKKFYQAWVERDSLKYRRLITNIFK